MRAAGTVLGFQACLEIVTGVGMVGYVAAVAPRRPAATSPAATARSGVLAGVISVIGFLAYLAAAQRLPLGPVTALRETSVIFGAVIGTLVLQGGLRPAPARRPSTMVVAGITLLALWR